MWRAAVAYHARLPAYARAMRCPPVPRRAISIRACYEMSGAELAYGAIRFTPVLRASRQSMSSTPTNIGKLRYI
eukprot:2946013-Rhodomonas_salina.4